MSNKRNKNARKKCNKNTSNKVSQPAKCIGIGAYWKENTSQGFGITVTGPQNQPMIDKLHEIVGNTKHNYECWEKDSGYTKHQMATALFGQLEDEILPILWKEMYGTTEYPQGPTFNVQMTNEIVSNMGIFFMNVSWLTDNGFIKNDNYNGMTFMYR